MKKFLLCLIASLSLNAYCRPESTPATTALSLLLAENPLADWRTIPMQVYRATIEMEVRAVFASALTNAGRQAFLTPPPFELGRLTLGVDAATAGKLSALFSGGQKLLDLTAQKTGIARLDDADEECGATALERTSYGFILHLPEDGRSCTASPSAGATARRDASIGTSGSIPSKAATSVKSASPAARWRARKPPWPRLTSIERSSSRRLPPAGARNHRIAMLP